MQQKLILKAAIPQTTTKPLTFNAPDMMGFFQDSNQETLPQSMVLNQLLLYCLNSAFEHNYLVQIGGLESNVVFIDAANSSSLSNILQAAELQRLDPKAALGRVINMRAYTAISADFSNYGKLEETVETSGAKLVVISDIVCSFLNDNVDDQEAKTFYSQIMGYLASFAKKHRIIIIATYLPHDSNRRNSTLQEITNQKANTVLRFTKTLYTSEVELEKHPSYMLGVVDFTPEVQTSNDFAATNNVKTRLTYSIL